MLEQKNKQNYEVKILEGGYRQAQQIIDFENPAVVTQKIKSIQKSIVNQNNQQSLKSLLISNRQCNFSNQLIIDNMVPLENQFSKSQENFNQEELNRLIYKKRKLTIIQDIGKKQTIYTSPLNRLNASSYSSQQNLNNFYSKNDIKENKLKSLSHHQSNTNNPLQNKFLNMPGNQESEKIQFQDFSKQSLQSQQNIIKNYPSDNSSLENNLKSLQNLNLDDLQQFQFQISNIVQNYQLNDNYKQNNLKFYRNEFQNLHSVKGNISPLQQNYKIYRNKSFNEKKKTPIQIQNMEINNHYQTQTNFHNLLSPKQIINSTRSNFYKSIQSQQEKQDISNTNNNNFQFSSKQTLDIANPMFNKTFRKQNELYQQEKFPSINEKDEKQQCMKYLSNSISIKNINKKVPYFNQLQGKYSLAS